MALPGYQDFMLPLLELAADGQEHAISDAVDTLADRMSIDQRQRSELLPSGAQTRLENRVYWAGSYLKHAGLLMRPRRGFIQITSRGLDVLRQAPPRIDIAFLSQFDEFVQFKTAKSDRSVDPIGDSQTEDPARATPLESFDAQYQSMRVALARELLERVRSVSPRFFERVVVDLLVAMGYGGSRADAGQAIGRSGDDGIDGIIKEDKLGLDTVLVQAKRWQAPVGRPVVQGFAGSLEGHRARKGVLITTSSFTSDAEEYVKRIEKRIVLIDGEQLAELMIDHDVGVNEVSTYRVKRVDSDYFEEE